MIITWSVTDGFNATTVDIADHGLLVGDGIFETMKVTDQGVFALNRHLNRLIAGAKLIDLQIPARTEILAAIELVLDKLKQSNIAQARLRLTVTSGAGPVGPERGKEPFWFIRALAISPKRNVVKVHHSEIVRNEFSILNSVKSVSYLETVVAYDRALKLGFQEALLSNTQGYLAEGAFSNLLFVVKDLVITPTLKSGCLPGVGRQIVIEQFGVQEVDLLKTELVNSQGAALVSSIRGVQLIESIDAVAIPQSPALGDLLKKFDHYQSLPDEYVI